MVWLVSSMEAQLCQDLIKFVEDEAHRFLMIPDPFDCSCRVGMHAPSSIDQHTCAPGRRFQEVLAKIGAAKAFPVEVNEDG